MSSLPCATLIVRRLMPAFYSVASPRLVNGLPNHLPTVTRRGRAAAPAALCLDLVVRAEHVTDVGEQLHPAPAAELATAVQFHDAARVSSGQLPPASSATASSGSTPSMARSSNSAGRLGRLAEPLAGDFGDRGEPRADLLGLWLNLPAAETVYLPARSASQPDWSSNT